MRIYVEHGSYGCDTGCCGHWITVEDDSGVTVKEQFEFAHPHGDDPVQFAKDLVAGECGAEHVADLDWGHCIISDGWGC